MLQRIAGFPTMNRSMRKDTTAASTRDAKGMRVAIVTGDYHTEIHERLLAGARGAFLESGGREADLHVSVVDGVYDLPPVAASAMAAGFDAVIALGCVVRGETRHDRHIVDAAFSQLSAIAVAHRRPVGLGVLTVENMKQARERAGGRKGDAGAFAMRAAIRAAREIRALEKAGRR
jgi:6,7-dimethyl-8-ribityllumazine synthase